MNETQALATALVNARDLPEPALAAAERLLLDWLAVTTAGAAKPAARALRNIISGWGASTEATLFGASTRASAPAAALVNGAAAHVLELDDLHAPSTLHPGAPIIAAAVAVAERENASGLDLLRAIVLGYEAAIRIGEAVNPSHYRYWHPTGTVATFGAAVAAGALLRLTVERMTDAFGTAGTQAAGLWEFNATGAMSKPLHAGKAAFNGLLAADLAARNFTGAPAILEGERGFLVAMASSFDAKRITDALGAQWKIAETSIKRHACCGHTHTAIDALLSLRTAALPTSIEIETYGQGYAIVNNATPQNQAQAQFSLAYVAAAAWLDGEVTHEQFSPARFAAISAFLPRIAITVAADLSASYPATWPARVQVAFEDGTRRTAASDHPVGSPASPLTIAQHQAKVASLVGPAEASRLQSRIAALRSARNVSELFLAPSQ
ncbi:MAG TPA: MmgE/PrpD family protein [Terriglobales bacterium]